MSYSVRKWEIQEAYNQITQYEYALIYMISEIRLVCTKDAETLNWTECIEARFFSDDKELHIFEQDGEKVAVEVYDTGEPQDEIIKEYPLAHKFHYMGKKLYVKEYIEYDEDGQAYVALTRLQEIR